MHPTHTGRQNSAWVDTKEKERERERRGGAGAWGMEMEMEMGNGEWGMEDGGVVLDW